MRKPLTISNGQLKRMQLSVTQNSLQCSYSYVPMGKRSAFGLELCLEQHHFYQILLKHFTSLGLRGLLETSTSFTWRSAGQYMFFNVVFNS